MSGGIYTTNKIKTLDALADVDFNNLQNDEAPLYNSATSLFENKAVLTPSSLPSGSSGDVVVSDGSGGLDSTNKLNVNPSNGFITGQYVNVDNSTIKLSTSAGTGAGTDTISIGYQAGLNANTGAVSIGTIAGQSAGTNSVSIGFNAKADDNNCIVINATGSLLESGIPNSCNIAPIRNINATILPSPYVVQYDDLTKELFKSEDLHIRDIKNRDIQNNGTLTNVGTASLYNGQLTVGTTPNRAIVGAPNAILSVDLQNRRVGINILNPTEDLDIDGNIQLNSSTTSKIVFYDSNDAHEHAEIDATDDGTTGGMLQFHTKEDGGSVSEKLRINNVGAIGFRGANYGSAYNVLVNNASGLPQWSNTLTNITSNGYINVNGLLQVGGSSGTGGQLLQSNGTLTHPIWVDPPKSKVYGNAYLNSNETLYATSGVLGSQVAWTDTVDQPSGLMNNNVGTGFQIIIPRAGHYKIEFHAGLTAASTPTGGGLTLKQNGTAVAWSEYSDDVFTAGDRTYYFPLSVEGIFNAANGDIFTCEGIIYGASNLIIQSNASVGRANTRAIIHNVD